MSNSDTTNHAEWWSRPLLVHKGPVRTAGGFYRTAEGGQGGVGGVPLTSAEDAVVAAVRLAYNVAAAQVDRSARLAQRLREAGDRAVGSRSDRKALDATEQLVFRGMMGALTWLEGAAAETDSPLKRLMTAEYELVGKLLGLAPSKGTRSPRRHAPEATSRGADVEEPDGPEVVSGRLKVVHKGEHRRPVRTRRCEVASGRALNVRLQLFSVEHIEYDPMDAEFAIDVEGRAIITLEVPRLAPAGLWRAAVCDAAGVQIGLIEIEL